MLALQKGGIVYDLRTAEALHPLVNAKQPPFLHLRILKSHAASKLSIDHE